MSRGEGLRLDVHPTHPQARQIERCAQSLAGDGLALCPTDAGYALVWGLDGTGAEERVRRLRQLDTRHPFTLCCASISDASRFARLDDRVYRLLRRLGHSPVTYLLPASGQLPNRLRQCGRGKRRDIGIRLPGHPVAQALLEACGGVLLSATLRSPDMDADEAPFLGHEADAVADLWLHGVDVMLDAGHCDPGPTSILDCTGDAPVLLRQGFTPVDLD
ncbi:MAG: L-threonylcarbamoyladenylate synthase [Lysobacteraceae bacterium]|nr:Sua5/YciO/YrdC/YwlC family protein [Silanimonas sp.]